MQARLIRRAALQKEPRDLAASLEDDGLRCNVAEAARVVLVQYLSRLAPARIMQAVNRTGWHEGARGAAYVLPDGATFGAEGHDVMLRSDLVERGALVGTRGTLAEWNAHVARYAVGNTRVAFAIGAAFAAPLLHLTGTDSGGFHLRGAAQSDKSTTLFAAASVTGLGSRAGLVRSWRATSNGLEGVASATCDSLLCLDGLGQADPREVEPVIYMVANEGGKSRASRSGGARERATWRALFLSSGEVSVEAKISEASQTTRAGLDVRLAEIDADAGQGLGTFGDLHGLPSAAALAQHIKRGAALYYRTGARAFLGQLAGDHAAAETAERHRAAFMAARVPPGAGSQVASVARRFALVAAGAEMAIAYGVVDWPTGTGEAAAAACFAAWLVARGDDAGNGEERAAIEQVHRFIVANGESRFAPLGTDLRHATRDCVGWADYPSGSNMPRRWFIVPALWRNVVCRGIDARRAAIALRARGLLDCRDDRHYTKRVVIGGQRVEVYVVTPGILSPDEPPMSGVRAERKRRVPALAHFCGPFRG